MKTTLTSFLILSLTLLSFTKPKKPILSLEAMKKEMKLGYSYVPSGSINFDGKTVSIQGFFMLKTEVSNMNYHEYLAALKLAGKTDEYNAALPDTTAWRTDITFNEKYVEYYFSHPAYRDFPVVNISKEQAEKYCEWLTQVWREKTGNSNLIFRLPMRAEYLKACFGNSTDRPYAWNSPYIINEKGQPNCNFLNVGAGAITRDSITGEFKVVSPKDDAFYQNISAHMDLMAPVKSYFPNEFDIYNLNGNVAEMVSEAGIAVGGDWNSPGYDVRNQSTKHFIKANPMVGFRPVMTFVESK